MVRRPPPPDPSKLDRGMTWKLMFEEIYWAERAPNTLTVILTHYPDKTKLGRGTFNILAICPENQNRDPHGNIWDQGFKTLPQNWIPT